MRRHRKGDERFMYACIGGINLFVALMFVTMLWPQPTPAPAVAYTAPPPLQLKEVPKREPVVGTPSRVEVPSVGIDMGVKPGNYDAQSKTWTLDTSSAFYATVTVPTNNTHGTTLIYGHAGWGIFEALPAVEEGAEAIVHTAEGYTFKYVFASSRQVVPTDVSFLTSTGPPRLVLQTCSGAFDSYRTLVTFHFKEVIRHG